MTFKNTRHTEHLERFIENRFHRLKKIHPGIIQCTVTVTTPHRSQLSSAPKQVKINISIPGRTLTAQRKTHPGKGFDLYSAISDAFHALEIQAESRSSERVNYKNFRKPSYLNSLHAAG